MRAFALSLCACLLAALALTSSASAQIAIDRGIAGARIGNTKAQVHAALGTPTSKQTGQNDFGTFLQETYALGDTRAVMIEGPSREAIELVEM